MIDETTKAISIQWCAQDIIDCAAEWNEATLSEEEAWEILLELYHNHDCNYGLTWGHIQAEIEDYLTERGK